DIRERNRLRSGSRIHGLRAEWERCWSDICELHRVGARAGEADGLLRASSTARVVRDRKCRRARASGSRRKRNVDQARSIWRERLIRYASRTRTGGEVATVRTANGKGCRSENEIQRAGILHRDRLKSTSGIHGLTGEGERRRIYTGDRGTGSR